MLTLTCPYCGVQADETELRAGGQAHLKRQTVGSRDAEFEDYLFSRENPLGVHFERWQHAYGCGKWFLAARDTMTLEVFGSYKAQTLEPPKSLQNAIKKKRPDWKGWT